LAQPPDDHQETPSGARRGYESFDDAQLAPSDPATQLPQRAVGAGGTYGAGPRSASSAAPAGDRRFRGALVRTVAGTFVPGLGLLGTRAHRLGALIVAALIVGTGTIALVVLRNPALTAGSALRSERVFTIGVVLAVLGLAWVAIIVGTYLISRPRHLTQTQRTIGAGLVGALSLLVSVPMAVGSAYAFETAALSGGLFQSTKDTKSKTRPDLDTEDPWADKAQVNLLLLGGDSGEGRDDELGVRTDTMMLASIDTATGSTLIIQLPRNLQNPPFPLDTPLANAFPWGFDNGSSSMLNAVWHDVPNMYPDVFIDTDYPGADALKWAVEGVTDLKVDYFVMVNIDGLVALVDAMGGVVVNVNFPIAMGGSDEGWNCGQDGWIPEGPNQRLNGGQAMWYARSRCNTPGADYGRMQRQSCLVDAIIDQAEPAKMATRYEGIAKAAGNMVETDIPQEHLPAMVELATRVQQGQNVQRLAFTEQTPGFNSAYPDFALMRQMIAGALDQLIAEPEPTEQPTTSAPTQTAPAEPTLPADPNGPAIEPTGPTTPESQVEDVGDACDYRHEEPAGGWIIPDTVPVYTPRESQTPQTAG
jgi:LCP family protein required for cell wall assembly